MLKFVVFYATVLARYNPFGVDVPLNFDSTHSLTLLRHLVILKLTEYNMYLDIVL